MGFSANEFLRFLDAKDIKKSKWQKIFFKYLKNADFYGWLFNPSPEQVRDYAGLTEQIFGKICESPKKIKLIIDMLDEEGANEFGRATSSFLYSIVNYGIDICNRQFKQIDLDMSSRKISRAEADDMNKEVEKFGKTINELNETLLDIIKKDAKNLADDSNMPKSVCKFALKQIPDPYFITNYKVGIYLNPLLQNIYSTVNSKEIDVDNIDWKTFFDEVFGKENRYDVATFIILEGANRLKSYQNKSVRAVWDSLTAYALKTLDKTDNNTRDHMVELYLKRISKMIKNGNVDLRVDLRSISESTYPNLTKAVDKYKSRFDDILSTVADLGNQGNNSKNIKSLVID